MGNMYERIVALCEQKGIKPGRVCADTGLSRGMMSDLKMGRTKELSGKNAKIVADYFGVTTDYLYGQEAEKAPTQQGERQPSDDEIKFALFGGGGEITDAMFDEVKNFAAYVKQREEEKKKKG